MSPKHLSLTPGPGNYAIPSKMIEGPKTAMHARSYMKDANERNNFPGAGSYELQNLSNPSMRKGPVFSMGTSKRGEDEKTKAVRFVPGAGSYSPNAAYT